MKKTILIYLVVLCTACSLGPDFVAPVVYKDSKIADNIGLKPLTNSKINPYWYKSFGDSELNQLIELGLRHSPNLKTAKENMIQARYQLYITRAGFLPFFDADGQYNKESKSPINELSVKTDYYQVGIDATWEIDIWGGQRRLNESALALLRAATADFENVKVALVSEIASQYINWKLAEKQIELTKKNLQLQQQIFETVEAKYKAGLADDLAYEQAKSALSSTAMLLPDLQTAEKSYQNALAVLVGKLPSDIIKTSANLLDKNLAISLESLYKLPADVVRNRPDVKAAEAKLAAQNALIGNAMANLFPTLSLKAFLGFQNNTLSPIFASDYNVYTNQAVLTMPMLHWGELTNKVKIQESETRKAYSQYQSALLTAVSDISNAIKTVDDNVNKNRSAKQNMTSNNKILKLSLSKYQNGLIDFSDVLTSQQNKLSADQEYSNSVAAIFLSVISFYKSVGGGLATTQHETTHEPVLKFSPCRG